MSPSSCSTGWCAGRGAIPRATTSPRPSTSPTGSCCPAPGRCRAVGPSTSTSARFAWPAWCLAVVMGRTLKGFEIRVQGSTPRAGRFAGFSREQDRVVLLPAVGRSRRARRHLRGGWARSTSCSPAISPGYGFTAIIVAFLGRLNPLGRDRRGPAAGAQLSGRRGRADRASASPTRSPASSRASCCSTSSPATP